VDFADQMRLVGLPVVRGERAPRRMRCHVGGSQQRVKSLDARKVARRDTRFVYHQASQMPVGYAQPPR